MPRRALFLGRSQELGAIAAARDEALAGRGSLFFLVGEPGIGKTRLADEACAHAAQHGFACHWGRAWESGGAPAYWPWTQLLSAALGERGPALLSELGTPHLTALRAVLPELRPTTPSLPSRPNELDGQGGEEARFAVFRAVTALLGRLCKVRPHVLVLDDLHAADASSLSLLHFVARELRALPVLLIGTYRDVEARLSLEAGHRLAQAGREAQVLPLPRLGSEEVAQYVRQSASDVPEHTVRSMYRATQGNPLFLDEVVRGWLHDRSSGHQPDADAALERSEDVLLERALPFGVREAIRQQLGNLPAELYQLLEVAAVIGNEFSSALVSATAKLGLGELESALERARDAGMLVERPGGQRAFSHGLVREVLYRDLSNPRRRQLHQAIAEALERAAGGIERPWAELAHHYLEAGPDFVSLAVERSLRAAGRALDAAASEDALRLLERAKSAHELAPPDLHVRTELLLAEGAARSSAGQGARGRELCREAAELARQLEQPELFARAALGYGVEFSFGATDPVLVQLLEQALGWLPEVDAILRARLLARLASARQPSIAPRETVRAALAAIDMARRIRDPATLLACLHTGMSALMDFVRSDERVLLNLEAERLALKFGDRSKALRARARLFFDYLELGDLGRADQNLAGYVELARELESERYLWPIPLFRGLRACMQGHFAEAEAALARAAQLGERVADPGRHWMLTFHRFGLERARDRHSELLALEPEIRAVLGSSPPGELWSALAVASVRARAGQIQEAAALLNSQDFELLLQTSDLTSLGLLAEVISSIQNRELAARVYPLLLPLQGRLFCYGMTGMFCEAPYDRQLGGLAALLGLRAQAHQHFESASEICRRLGLRPHLARCLFEHAEALLGELAAGDGAGDVTSAARTRLAEAEQLASELGLDGLRVSIARLSRELAQHSAPQASAPASAATLTPALASTAEMPLSFELRHEGEYWSLVAPGELLRLKDMRGLHLLQRLVSHPDQEFHVLDLATEDAAHGVALGDAGELLDPQARAAYRERVADLQESLRDAETLGDASLAGQLQQELDFLGSELARAVGLGGRERRAASAAERARVAVQKRIKDALRKIEEGAPALGRHLVNCIRTGTFCAYRPRGRAS